MPNRLTLGRIFRYLVAGGSATATNLALLYAFTEGLGLWYLFSAVLAFTLAFVVSFTLQKFWTFKDAGNDALAVQAGTFLTIAIVNLGLNTLGMFVLVSELHVWYMLAEVFMAALIAVESYVLYGRFVFAPGR